ncbi:MAG: hypothetical protein ACLFV6_05975 [Spirulinaceae cyanobacterium]
MNDGWKIALYILSTSLPKLSSAIPEVLALSRSVMAFESRISGLIESEKLRSRPMIQRAETTSPNYSGS